MWQTRSDVTWGAIELGNEVAGVTPRHAPQKDR
jgi:hypothetical protein